MGASTFSNAKDPKSGLGTAYPPDVAAIEEKLQETEVSAKEPTEKQQPEETAE